MKQPQLAAAPTIKAMCAVWPVSWQAGVASGAPLHVRWSSACRLGHRRQGYRVEHIVAASAKRIERASIGQPRNKSWVQVALRWVLQRGAVPVIVSRSLEHLRENLGATESQLDDASLKTLDSLQGSSRKGPSLDCWWPVDGRTQRDWVPG